MATFADATPERCAQLGRALTTANLGWSDDGHQDPHSPHLHRDRPARRHVQVSPATWQTSCAALMTRSPMLSARLVAERIKDVPA